MMREMMLHWSFGIFHVIQNEFLEFKIFNNSIDRLKAFQEKPSSLFGFQKNAHKWRKRTFSFLSHFEKEKRKKKRKKRKRPSAVSILGGISLYSRTVVGEKITIQKFNTCFILSLYQNWIFLHKKTFPTNEDR